MGFGWMIAGLIFLFNPNINVVDILPDCIGYLLIYHGLFAMSFAVDKLVDARSHLWKLIFVTAVRALSFMLLPYVSDMFTLLLATVFGILEAIYFFPFVFYLFEGFFYLGTKWYADSVFLLKEKTYRLGPKKGTTVLIGRAVQIRSLTCIFFILKTLGAILPELPILSTHSGELNAADSTIDIMRFRPLFYLFCVVIVAVVGVIWLVRILRYVRLMRSDAGLCENIRRHFTDHVLSRDSLMVALRMNKVRFLVVCAVLFIGIVTIDGVNILPNFVPAFLLIAAFAMMVKYQRKCWVGIVCAGCVGVVSIVNMFIQLPYFSEYTLRDSRYFARAASQYGQLRNMAILEYVLVCVMFIAMFVLLLSVIRQHMQYIGGAHDSVQYNAENRRKALYHECRVRMIVGMVLCVFSCVLNGAYYIAGVYIESFGTIALVGSALGIFGVIYAMSAAHVNIYERLQMDL